MFFGNKNRREFTEETAPEKKPLKLKVKIELESMESYSSTKNIVVLEHTEVLNSSTDSRIKEIKGEVEEKLKELYDKTMAKVENNDQLTDGFHAELAVKKAKEAETV